MTLPSSGSLSLSQVRDEHGGNLPLSMSQLLRSGTVGSLVHSNNTIIPSAPPLSLSNLLGTSRLGYYPITIGLVGTVAENNRQFGVNIGGGIGAMLYNNKFKGYDIGWVIWNEFDNTFGISLAAADIPQSVVTGFGTVKSGLKAPMYYSGNFYGFSVWNTIHSTNPFTAVGTLDNSFVIL